MYYTIFSWSITLYSPIHHKNSTLFIIERDKIAAKKTLHPKYFWFCLFLKAWLKEKNVKNFAVWYQSTKFETEYVAEKIIIKIVIRM